MGCTHSSEEDSFINLRNTNSSKKQAKRVPNQLQGSVSKKFTTDLKQSAKSITTRNPLQVITNSRNSKSCPSSEIQEIRDQKFTLESTSAVRFLENSLKAQELSSQKSQVIEAKDHKNDQSCVLFFKKTLSANTEFDLSKDNVFEEQNSVLDLESLRRRISSGSEVEISKVFFETSTMDDSFAFLYQPIASRKTAVSEEPAYEGYCYFQN